MLFAYMLIHACSRLAAASMKRRMSSGRIVNSTSPPPWSQYLSLRRYFIFLRFGAQLPIITVLIAILKIHNIRRQMRGQRKSVHGNQQLNAEPFVKFVSSTVSSDQKVWYEERCGTGTKKNTGANAESRSVSWTYWYRGVKTANWL